MAKGTETVQARRQTRDSITDVWGPRAPYFGEGRWPVRVDERVLEEPQRWVQSACVLCSNGCGIDLGVRDGRIVGVRGRAEDRVNHGRLGPKGLHGWEANASADRLTQPLVRRHGKLRPASWDEAMDLIVDQTRRIVGRYTSGAVAFYTSGQLFLEEYYTLAVLGKAGLGTPHMDGNTRLCTATAAAALRETFGCDGQPGSYEDFDVADCMLLVGHNMAETQTVLWTRVLDRRRGPNPPKLIVIDPRLTPTAAEADVHLAPRAGTNVAVLNGLLHLLIEEGRIDEAFVRDHTVGLEKLRATVARYGPERVRELSGLSTQRLREAARLIGASKALLSTCLQGVYQSHQATAAACQVNNINLLRGMIGRPGAGVLQMNGQPTAQNNRETGCNGEFTGFRNHHNDEHMRELARLWNVDVDKIPRWSLPTHAMEIFRLVETGSVRMLWIAGTNPAVSLPELARVREVMRGSKVFLVVNDAWPTETTELADVVLPAAIWAEKTGTYTNADRTVHLSRKAVDPPGQARSDLDIWLDFAKRMDFRDKDGLPLIKWSDPEGAFERWKEATAGKLCDYTGLSYEKLTGGSGVQWPCGAASPQGTPRLYADHVFPTASDVCESHGHDLETGGAVTAQEYRANDPKGRAILKGADYEPPLEQPSRAYPFRLTTGRVVHHWHTRTKTGRAPELRAAAPEPFVELNADDAKRLGVVEGDVVEVASRRGMVRAPARVTGIAAGHVFVPFHYGYWDEDHAYERAANELTVTGWDPISKQPYFKYAAVQVRKGVAPLRRLADASAKRAHRGRRLADMAASRAHGERARVADYLALAAQAQAQWSLAARKVAAAHPGEPEMTAGLSKLAGYADEARALLEPFAREYGKRDGGEPAKMRRALFPPARPGAFGLLRDLHDLYLMASECGVTLLVARQAALGLRDRRLIEATARVEAQNSRQVSWLMTHLKKRAPQTLIVPQ